MAPAFLLHRGMRHLSQAVVSQGEQRLTCSRIALAEAAQECRYLPRCKFSHSVLDFRKIQAVAAFFTLLPVEEYSAPFGSARGQCYTWQLAETLGAFWKMPGLEPRPWVQGQHYLATNPSGSLA